MKKHNNTKRVACIVTALLCAATVSFTLSGCRESDRVSYNVSREADSFNVTRKLTVLNVRTDTIMMELTGTFSISNSSAGELAIICKTGDGVYKKHYVYLNDWTAYTVEDISGADVDPYNYEIRFYPQMIPGIDMSVEP